MAPDKRRRFAEISFKGSRFDGGVLPLDVLGELVTFRSIIMEIAKSVWREQHPTRKRLPKGFEDYFQLSFVDVHEGSAVAEISRETQDLTPLFPDGDIYDIFDKAQSIFLKGIAIANTDGSLGEIPEELTGKLANLGKRIQPKEALEFRSTGSAFEDGAAILTQKTRELIFRRAGQSFEKIVEGFGILRGTNESKSCITVLSELGEFDFEVPLQSVRLKFDGKIGEVVEFSVEATIGADGLAKKIASVHYVDIVEEGDDVPRIIRRLEDFSLLQKGWLDGVGEPISSAACRQARDLARFINSIYSDLAVFPTPEGGVRFEWADELVDISVEIEPSETIFVHVLNMKTDAEHSYQGKGISRELLGQITNARDNVGANDG